MTYNIVEIARMLEVSREALRLWERKGLIPKPRRSPTRFRRYSDDDIKAIKGFLERRR